MKKAIPILLVAICLTIFGCKKDSTQKSDSTIAGTWYYTNNVVIVSTDGVAQPQSNGGVAFDGTFWMQFNADGTGITSYAGTVTRFTYSISGSTITLNTPAQAINVGPNNIQISASSEKATIKALTASNLELYFDDKDGNDENTQDAFLSKTKP